MFACSQLALIYYSRRRVLALQRRHLRDTLNPFEMSEERFMEMYRLPPLLAKKFIEEIEEYATDNYEDERKIPLHLEVLSLLNFLASGSYQRRVGMDSECNMSQTMTSRILRKISKIITNHLAPKYVIFPQTQGEAQIIKDKFLAKTQIPGILGLVDGTHVALTCLPNREEHIYVNRKNYHSINVQINNHRSLWSHIFVKLRPATVGSDFLSPGISPFHFLVGSVDAVHHPKYPSIRGCF
uniref:Nuclease HARBI1 n=1 Tax=Phlebotomus papatasi TaxID=29031 RepID=A0A1B0DHJ9_PHLPP